MKEIVVVVENHLGYKMENLEENIKDIMSKSFLIERERLEDDAHLQDDLGVDSLGLFEMVINLEDAYGIELNDKELLKFARVGQAVEVLARLIREQVKP